MRVNLLQGTYTPTLTPIPGVHNQMESDARFARAAHLERQGQVLKYYFPLGAPQAIKRRALPIGQPGG